MTVRISIFSLTARILAVVCMAVAPLVAEAAGLGRLSVLSSLGQPLNAEVEIISLQPGEEEGLSARLAPMEAFKQAGIDFNSALLSVKFAIEQRNGKPVLKMTSGQAINEPFLDLLVELQWNAGRLVREYTFLLDPPQFRAAAPAPVAPAQPQTAVVPAPAVRPAVVPAGVVAPRAPESPVAVAVPASAAAGGTYQVRRGDTLAGVARKNLPQGTSFNQMLVALFRANGDAFEGGNINRLRAGKILSLPGAEAVSGVDREEARKFLESQAGEFAQYRRRLASAVASAPGSETGAARSASGAITAPSTQPVPAAPKDEVKLSKADAAKRVATQAAKGDDKVASGRAAKDAQSRAQELEKTVTDLQKMLDLKNRQLAELEAKGAKSAPQPAAAPAVKAAAPVAEPLKAAAVVPAAPAAAPVDAKTEPAKAPEAKPAVEAPKPASPKTVVKAPPPPPAPSFADELLESATAIGGIGVVVVLLGAYGAWAWRRKKKAAAAVLGDVASAGPAVASAAPVANPAVAAQVEAAIASANLAPQESDEVDPVAEADVYMAYGRDAQAEEILKEALQKDPARVPVLAKMVEIYAQRRDAKGLEEYALKIKSATGGEGAEWEKAAALGQSVDPDNGLYSGVTGANFAAAAPVASPALDFDLDGSATAETPSATVAAPDVALDFDIGAADAASGSEPAFSPDKTVVVDPTKKDGNDLGLDFDLGEPEAKVAQLVAKAEDAGLDFDLGSGSPEVPDTGLPELSTGMSVDKGLEFESAGKTAPDPDNSAIDFDLNLDLGSPGTSEAKTEMPSIDLGSISLDLDAPGVSEVVDPKWQNAADKLDLAKAFEEMNDKSGARDLLNEVLRDGDAAQRQLAQEMLGRLG